MRNELLNLKQREQELIDDLHVMSTRSQAYFDSLKVMMEKRGHKLDELTKLQEHMNNRMEVGAEEILDDIRNGKLGLVNAQTGEPATVALFAKR